MRRCAAFSNWNISTWTIFWWALIIPAATLDSWNGAHYQGLWGDSTTFDLPRSQDISSLWKNHPSPTPYQHSTLWTSLRSSSISASMPVRLNVLVARCHIGRVTGTEPECDTMYVLNCFDSSPFTSFTRSTGLLQEQSNLSDAVLLSAFKSFNCISSFGYFSFGKDEPEPTGPWFGVVGSWSHSASGLKFSPRRIH